MGIEKAQLDLFKACRANKVDKARKAYEKGANVNWPLDKWMIRGRQHWGLRVHSKPLGIYLGFSDREEWLVPDGEAADRGDTLIMVALKCRMRELVAFLVGCNRLNPNCLNEAGNSAVDIARATGQEFLLRDGVFAMFPAGVGPVAAAQPQDEEALPAWEQGVRHDAGGGGGATEMTSDFSAPVVAHAVPVDPSKSGSYGGEVVYATAQTVGDASYPQSATATAAPVHVSTPIQPDQSRRRHGHNPYDPSDGGGRANLNTYGTGTGAGRVEYGLL